MMSERKMDVRSSEETEHDAIHRRFLEEGPPELIVCGGCDESFTVTSNLDIIKHFQDVEHPTFFRNCVYCKGKVHSYKFNNGRVAVYHDCFRWKRGLDK